MDDERYDRQRRLREIGARGQALIERSSATLPPGPGADVAMTYLRRAGVAQVTLAEGATTPASNASWLHFSGPRAVACGAFLALQHLLASIEKSE